MQDKRLSLRHRGVHGASSGGSCCMLHAAAKQGTARPSLIGHLQGQGWQPRLNNASWSQTSRTTPNLGVNGWRHGSPESRAAVGCRPPAMGELDGKERCVGPGGRTLLRGRYSRLRLREKTRRRRIHMKVTPAASSCLATRCTRTDDTPA